MGTVTRGPVDFSSPLPGNMKLLSLACIAPALLVSGTDLADNDEYKLRAHLAEMQAFNPSVRPVPVWTDRVNVRVGVNFNGLTGVDEGAGTVTNSVIMAIAWEDHFMKWDADAF